MPDERGLPTKEEIAQLPRWARVAFAARCAARVRRVYEVGLDHSTFFTERARKRAVRKAIDIASRAARLADSSSKSRRLALSAQADAKESAMFVISGPGLADARAACGAANAAAAAAAAAANPDDSAIHALDALRNAAWAVQELDIGQDSRDRFAGAAHRDILALHSITRLSTASARDDVSAPMKLLGPLWPDGEPYGWPGTKLRPKPSIIDDGGSSQRLIIKLAVPPLEDTPENRAALRAHIKSVVRAASAIHVAHGGSGLTIGRMRAYVPSRVADPKGVS